MTDHISCPSTVILFKEIKKKINNNNIFTYIDIYIYLSIEGETRSTTYLVPPL